MMAKTTNAPLRVMVLGATGEIGRAAVRALVGRGHAVVCLCRPQAGVAGALDRAGVARLLEGAAVRFGDATDPTSLARDGFRGERFDALVSCLASRSGAPEDAWAVDHQAHVDALAAAQAAGARHVVLLSAICVQKPTLAFQHAKLAFEAELVASGLTYSIVRPTAYFKSLSGQIDRLRAGKPYLLFGDGRLTATKPISARDLGAYLADCLENPAYWNRILPIGGPGPALSPLEMGEILFEVLGREPKFRRVPVRFFDAIIAGLTIGGKISPKLGAKAELARIGRYYATESMLVRDPATGRYDAAATPETGSDTLLAYYERLASGAERLERGDHAVF